MISAASFVGTVLFGMLTFYALYRVDRFDMSHVWDYLVPIAMVLTGVSYVILIWSIYNA